MANPKAPGLKWIRGRPYWVAPRKDVEAGFPVKTVNLSSVAPENLVQRALRLQGELLAWRDDLLNEGQYDGTLGSVFRVYQRDPESPYRKLKPGTLVPYNFYLKMLEDDIGHRAVRELRGKDVMRWFANWRRGADGEDHLPRARMALAILKAAVHFGAICGFDGCPPFSDIVSKMRWEAPKSRTTVIDAAMVVRARQAAHAAGMPSLALGIALQFETGIRQWDITGRWVPLSDKRPSAIIRGRTKWVGPTWANVDADMVLRIMPSKTDGTTNVAVEADLRLCPMVLEELPHVTSRIGPLIVNQFGRPFANRAYGIAWRLVAKSAGIPNTVWNRDLRAGAITEARRAGAATDDVAKAAGHSTSRTTAQVYDRAQLEAQRRMAKARTAMRGKGDE